MCTEEERKGGIKTGFSLSLSLSLTVLLLRVYVCICGVIKRPFWVVARNFLLLRFSLLGPAASFFSTFGAAINGPCVYVSYPREKEERREELLLLMSPRESLDGSGGGIVLKC